MSNGSENITTDTYFKKLAIPLQNQLEWMYKYVGINSKIHHLAKKIHEKYGGSEKSCYLVAILKYYDAQYFLTDRWNSHITGYSPDGRIVELHKEIKRGKHVHVYRARLHDHDQDRDVVAKWYSSPKFTTQYEINIYRELATRNCPLPWFSDKFLFWQTPLLVLEKLEPLDQTDNPYQIGISILIQLTYLHQFAVHNGIKPDNIMKRVVAGVPQYLLIDFGGTTTERLAHGYRRWLHSPKWTSQEPHEHRQVTTARNDFLELGFTMKSLTKWSSSGPDVRHARTGFTGRLKKYMKHVESISEFEATLPSNYEKLIQILQN